MHYQYQGREGWGDDEFGQLEWFLMHGAEVDELLAKLEAARAKWASLSEFRKKEGQPCEP